MKFTFVLVALAAVLNGAAAQGSKGEKGHRGVMGPKVGRGEATAASLPTSPVDDGWSSLPV